MLPPEVVISVLQHVPQQPRLATCALVCRSWQTAASLATCSATLQLPQQAQLDSLGLWLDRRGAALKVLSIRCEVPYSYRPLKEVLLPIQQLRSLESLCLANLEVDVAPIVASGPSGHCLSALTSLQLHGVRLQTGESVKLLTQPTGLRNLHLLRMIVANSDASSKSSMRRAVTHWTHMTALVLDDSAFGDIIVNGLGELTQLQQLQLTKCDLRTAEFNLISVCLIRLECNNCHIKLAPSTQLFHNLLELQHLELKSCPLSDKADIVALLAALPQLAQLKHLSLAGSLCETTGVEHYTSLVSSTQLTYLDLMKCRMPGNAVYHMFAAKCHHLALDSFMHGGWDPDELDLWEPATVCAGAFDRLVSRCPSLAVLHLAHCIQPDLVDDMTVLEQLTTLSKLALTGSWASDERVELLANLELPALRDLEIGSVALHWELNWTAQGVLHLRGMTQLTRLRLDCGNWDLHDESHDHFCMEFVNQGGLLDLREQVSEYFKDEGNFTTLLLREKQEECVVALRRVEAAEYAAEAARRIARAAEQRAEAAEQRAEAAAQRAEAAEQKVEQLGQHLHAALQGLHGTTIVQL